MENCRKYETPQLINLRMEKEGSGMPVCNDGSGETYNCSLGNSAGDWCANGTAAGNTCFSGASGDPA